MSIRPDDRIHLQQRLEDAGFTRPEAVRLARVAADGAPGGTAARITAALDDLQFPVGAAAESRRARLWDEVFPASADGGSSDPAPSPGWYAGAGDERTERYWDGTGWTGRRTGSPTAEPDADPARGTVLTIVGFCLGVVALVIAPFLPGSLAVAVTSVVFAAIGLGSPAATSRGGIRALGTAGLVLGIIALVQVLSFLFLPGTVGTPFGVVVP